MPSHRLDRIRNLLRQVTSEILSHIKDPRVGFVTITDVEVSPDLRHAKVFVSVLGDETQRAQALKGLESARGFVRRELFQKITLRHIPEVTFLLDDSLDRGLRVSELLAEAKRKDAALLEESGDDRQGHPGGQAGERHPAQPR